MDDMNKYLSALGQSSEATSKIDSANAASVDVTSAFNAKLREVHSQVEGVTAPGGIGLFAKGVSKIGRGTFQRAGLGEAYDDYSAEGVTGLVRGATNRNVAGKMDELLQRGEARVNAAKAGQPLEEEGVFDAKTGLNADEQSQLDNLVSKSGKAAPDEAATDTAADAGGTAGGAEATAGGATGATAGGATATAGGADATAGGATSATATVGAADADATTAVATGTIETASAEGSLASATAASTADDWNPIGIVTTIGLGLATLFAGIFGHKKEEVARHVQTLTLNPSTQFGV